MTEECEVAGYKWAAEVFDPDRFYNVGQDNDKQLENKYSLIIFGGSPRIYPERKLALSELLLLMASICIYYNVELMDMHKPLKIVAAKVKLVLESIKFIK
ncbi:cytochrome P450 [Gigaspora margarita]|uniref:Cytochrome P450 n=1 Tax=Gigaspora margarita TaxID=4874 RepID=A0A8H4B3N5_GIGMA|nr:cytochrome P450 [Gigaspora margarita]